MASVALLSRAALAQEQPGAPAAPEPEAAPAAAAAAPVKTAEERAADAARDARIQALEAQLAQLNARLDERQSAPLAAAQVSPPPAPLPRPEPRWYERIEVSAYAQAQLEFHQDSEDQLAAGGQPLNQNRFTLRRARLKAESKYRYSEFVLELDGNTLRGPSFGVQRAEVAAVYRGAGADVTQAPLVALTAGVFLPPFGRELQESARTRRFMERSLASRAFFPSEPDLGARLSGTLGFFNYGIAVTNGEPAGQQQGFPLRDPNAAKDLIARLGVAADVSRVVKASGGVSLLNGTSTFRGTDGTKAVVNWVDANEDNQLSNVELTATPGSSPRRSQNFKHWAVGADVDVAVETGLGTTELQAEITIASNLDRGLFISDPITVGHDERQFGYNVGLVQDITRHAFAGLRYDYYDPRADVFTSTNGRLVPSKASIRTLSPMLGARLPYGLKLYGQWDLTKDRLATDLRGVPADRKNNAVIVRLQGEL